MGINVWPADAVAGAPSYTGRKLRQLIGGVLTGKTSARPLGGRSGVWPGTPSTTVSISAGNWQVGPHAGALDLETANEAGPYFYSTDANPYVGTAVTAADATNPRVDIVYAQLSDPAESDGTSTPGVAFGYLAGTPAGTPTPPATPTRSMVLAQLNVPNVAGGGVSSATVTWVAPYTVAAGGIQPARTVAERPALPYDGLPVYRQDLNAIEIYNGATWDLFPPRGSGIASLDGAGSGGRITGGTSGSPQTLHTPTPTSLTAPPWANNARITVLLGGLYLDTAAGNNFQARLAFGPSNGAYRRVPEVPTAGPRFPQTWIETLAVTPGVANTITIQAYRNSGTGALNCDSTASQVSLDVDWLP
jgi:hypothetical protein